MAGNDVFFPDSTKKFVLQLNRAIQRKNVYDIQHLYEHEFNYQTTKYFKASPWPSAATVAPSVDNDENFLVLYEQLHFRHIYVRKLSVGIQDHLASYQNYMDLFNIILGLTTEAPEFEIPEIWLWDMIDEFVYQFVAFHNFRNRVDELSELDKAALAKDPHVWSVQTVIRYLLELVKKGGLAGKKHGEDSKEAKSSSSIHPLFQTLAEFAAIGLSRVNCLMGDHMGAIEALDPINMSHRHDNAFTSVPAAAASLHYNLGFSYLLSRRYADCIRTISDGLMYLSRNKHLIPRNYQQQNINKVQEQMFGVLALATSLVPQRVDESIASGVRDRYGSQMQRMRAIDTDAFKEVFVAVCPKFIALQRPSKEQKAGAPDAGLKLQLTVFLDEVRQLNKVPDIYSYLKMCTAIAVPKLASFLNEKEDILARRLLYLKHKTQGGRRWTGGSPSNGDLLSSSDLSFKVSDGLVHVSEPKKSKRHADFFIRNILNYEHLITEVEASGRIAYY